MKYKVGMYGGSFDPLHVGHIHDIIRVASECETLYVIISWCEGRESTSKELRYRWIYNCCKHLPNIKIYLLEDEAVDKETYNTDYYWEKGADDIKALIKDKIDAVYCGTDYLGTNRFESLYEPVSKVIYFDRKEVPISSTDIRKWATDNWDYIPKICKPYYTRKVLVIGGESTGKSTLVQNLALAYNTNFLREIGRDVCEVAGSEDMMIATDLEEILLKHKVEELHALKESNRILFIDTDALITKFYSHFLLTDEDEIKRCSNLADAISEINTFDLVLFIEPVNTFVQDGTRNEIIKNDRLKYSEQIKQIFEEHNIPYYILDGDYLDNFNQAKVLIKDKLNIDTKW